MPIPKHYTPNELLVAILAAELHDDEMGFVGVGSSGRAFSLAVGIPLLAGRLAQARHAPHYQMQIGPLIDPDLSDLPDHWNDATAYDRPAAAFVDAVDNIAALLRGGVDVSFISGAQVDRFGNLNITRIGEVDDARWLVGALALPEHQAFADRSIILADLSPRSFVERVDFVTGVGYLDGGDSRRAAGLGPGGPALVLTDKAIFDFTPVSREMRLRSVHPGWDIEEVLSSMSFEPVLPDCVPETPAPDTQTVALIRELDPKRMFLGAEPPGWTR